MAVKHDRMDNIPVLTIDSFPGRTFEVIGMVTAEFVDPKILKRIDISQITPELQRSASTYHADAVIGVRMYQYDAASVVAYGTAIRFI